MRNKKGQFVSVLGNQHKMDGTRFYAVFTNSQTRCNNTRTFNYPFYGGRGIKCLWKSFEEFRDDMYESYKLHSKKFGEKNTTLDRIDNNGNYCKENCRWASRQLQARNTRNNHLITFRNETHCIAEWAEIVGINPKTLYNRLNTCKWSEEKALTKSIMRNQFI